MGGGLTVTYREQKRLHPLTILYNSLSILPQVGLPFLLTMMGEGNSGDSLFILIPIAISILLLPGIYLGYINYHYYFTETDFVFQSGIFSKKQRSVPYKRIQNVAMKQNIFVKVFDLVSVSIETAGNAGKEAELRYVKAEEYERIKAIIGRKSRNISVEHQEKSDPSTDTSAAATTESENYQEQEQQTVYTMSMKEVLTYGALRIRPTIFVIFAWIWGMSSQYVGEDFWVDLVEQVDISSIESAIDSADWLIISLFTIAVIFIAFLISWIIDILLAVNTLWNFQLSRVGDKLFSERGLLNRLKKTIPLKKLQLAQINTNPIKKKFGYYGLDLFTAGMPGSGTKEMPNNKAIPLAKLDRLMAFLSDIIGVKEIGELKQVSKLTIRRAIIRYSVFIIALSLALYLTLDILWVSLVLFPLAFLAAYIRWKYRGYNLVGDKVIVKQGYFVQKISIIPLSKIQNIHVYSTFFQRRLGLMTFFIDTAAFSGFRDAAIIDISAEEADSFYQEIMLRYRELNGSDTVISPPVYSGKLVTSEESSHD